MMHSWLKKVKQALLMELRQIQHLARLAELAPDEVARQRVMHLISEELQEAFFWNHVLCAYSDLVVAPGPCQPVPPGPGIGPGFGPGVGPGVGPGCGPGTGPCDGPGMGPGVGPGFGPGVGPGFGPGTGPGAGPGMGFGPGAGIGFGPGVGMTPGFDPGMGAGGYPPGYNLSPEQGAQSAPGGAEAGSSAAGEVPVMPPFPYSAKEKGK